MTEQSTWKHRLPLVISSILVIVTLYMFGWAWSKVASVLISQYQERTITYMSWLFGDGQNLSLISVFVIGCVSVFGWLLSTRVSFYQKKYMRLSLFLLMVLSVWGVLAAYGMGQSRKRFIPFFQERLSHVIETNGFFESIVFEHTHGFYLMLTALPMFVMFFITLFVLTKFVRHDQEFIEPFFEFQWSGQWLQKFSKLEQREQWPDIELGLNSKTKEMVVMPGRDRTLNTIIIGSIGTGKTAALALPMLNQDLHHMTRFINTYPEIYEREDFDTEEVGGRHLNGISVIDPSNDLCQKTLGLVRAHGIPEEAITYINPLDPNTPSINPMRGPVDKVAEVFAQVIAGLNDSKDGGNFFFEQAQRNHLKHYIYLLKLHDPDQDVTFDMLLDMYNNPQMVRSMHEQLKKTFPSGFNDFEDRDERNYWKIVQGIDEWFDLNLLVETNRQGIPERTPDGEVKYYDAKQEHVQGLRNILNDIGANPLIRRVLFGKSDFDFDRHMAIGGVLLVNTAKGELVNLARVLGKIVLMNLQNASFRRSPNISPFHHILIDESPDYLYNAFREFPAQSRKYKVIVTPLMQTIAQLADQFGEHYMTTLIGTMRNRMVYGDVPTFDADYFSKMFGDKFVYEEGQSEMAVSPLQEDPMSRSGSSYSKVRDQAMTGGDIMYQDAFQCAVKLVVNNKPMPVVQVAANFVPKEEFEEAKFITDEEAADIWLNERRMFGINAPLLAVETDIQSIEETEEVNEENYQADMASAPVLDEQMMQQALNANVEPKPRDEIVYRSEQQEQKPFKKSGVQFDEIMEWQPIGEIEKDLESEPPQEELETPVASSSEPEEKAQPPQNPNAPSIPSGLSGIVSSWDDEADVTEEPPMPAEEYKEDLSPQLKTITEGQSVYQQSELNKEQEEFFDKFGVGIKSYTDK